MNKKTVARTRRALRTRVHIKTLEVIRLCVHRTPRHIYAQITLPDGAKTLVCASTIEPETRVSLKNGGNVEAAKAVGKLIAERAVKAGISKVAFDRSGYKYHGRIKALADAAREHGLQF
ncbi:MAG: 50S ribosomal protein L18 [Gammaproteobacteria bacterium]|nr:50S ribosomal protein L18 [Gammaproteobacteria bacterium]